MTKISLEHALVRGLGAGGYQILGLVFFAAMARHPVARGPAARRPECLRGWQDSNLLPPAS